MFKKSVLLWILLSVSFALAAAYLPQSSKPTPPAPVFVAHAGGAFNGDTYQNTIEALNENYARGFRFFELDFSWTSDHVLVGIHDWDGTYQRLFIDSSKIPDLEYFNTQAMKNGSTPITFERLDTWLHTHADVWIISDIKKDNLTGLSWIKRNYPSVSEKVIPQIYAPQEYAVARKTGYSNIILTMYRLPNSASEAVISLLKSESLLALTMPLHWFENQSLSNSSINRKIPICIHTINDAQTWENLQREGASCIYTDRIIGQAPATPTS